MGAGVSSAVSGAATGETGAIGEDGDTGETGDGVLAGGGEVGTGFASPFFLAGVGLPRGSALCWSAAERGSLLNGDVGTSDDVADGTEVEEPRRSALGTDVAPTPYPPMVLEGTGVLDDEVSGTGGNSRSMLAARSGVGSRGGTVPGGGVLGWSGISRMAVCAAFHASRFWRHHSLCKVDNSMASWRRSATFWRWKRSRSACSVVEAYLRSWADACSESSSCRVS